MKMRYAKAYEELMRNKNEKRKKKENKLMMMIA